MKIWMILTMLACSFTLEASWWGKKAPSQQASAPAPQQQIPAPVGQQQQAQPPQQMVGQTQVGPQVVAQQSSMPSGQPQAGTQQPQQQTIQGEQDGAVEREIKQKAKKFSNMAKNLEQLAENAGDVSSTMEKAVLSFSGVMESFFS